MILLDVTILVHLHRQDTDRHDEFTALQETAGVAVSDLVLSGFLRIVTHPTVFKKSTPLSKALEFLDDFRSREEVHILGPGPSHGQIFTGLCRKAEVRGTLIPAAYHAAFALEYSCEWITLDRGFARFPNLRWRHPLDD